mmetsp:Transcript_16508/g.29381  ORF Transcript_16508/g.29381 Transcript_16508/m.29381 type:complete len:90 (+) Transcript_16508:1927-2196(+)
MSCYVRFDRDIIAIADTGRHVLSNVVINVNANSNINIQQYFIRHSNSVAHKCLATTDHYYIIDAKPDPNTDPHFVSNCVHYSGFGLQFD